MKNTKRILLLSAVAVVLISLVFVSLVQHPQDPKYPEDPLDPLIEQAMKDWQVPGLAVGIIRDSKVIYLKAFGVRELDKPGEVTPDTLFPIASCTKSFTTAALALLADEGKLTFDDKVRKHVPYFKLADPDANDLVTLRDLVCHRTGVGTNEFLWYRAPWGPEESVRRIGHVPLKYPFRGGFEYQTTMFTTAGLAVEAASGRKWDVFVKERLLEPLDMKSVVFTTTDALKNPDHARPHRRAPDGVVSVMPFYEMKQPEPAGSIHASARDLTNWIRFQLNSGTFDGWQIVSAQNLEETHKPQVVVPMTPSIKARHPHTKEINYCLGWVTEDYHGKRVLMHAGAIDGFRAHFTLVPEERLGIVLLNNLHRTELNLALSNTILDHLLDLPRTDWNGVLYEQVRKDAEKSAKEVAALRKQSVKPRKPSLPIEAYVGAYENPAYGKCQLVQEKTLVWKWNQFKSPLFVLDGDSFIAENETLGLVKVKFTLSKDGKQVTGFKVDKPFEATFTKGERGASAP